MDRFKKQLNGYDIKQVNEFLLEKDLKAKSNEDTLKEKINLLEEEILLHKREIASFRDQEQALSKALLKVTELESMVKDEIESEKELEIERVELFRAKWEEYAIDVISSFDANVPVKLKEMIFEFKQSVTEKIEEALYLPKSRTYSSPEAEKLASMCRKLGILED